MKRRLAGAVLFFLAACGGADPGNSTPTQPGPPVVTTVSILPSATSISITGVAFFAFEVRDQNGLQMSGQSASWSTSDSTVATVDRAGTVNGVSVGTATITATVGSKSASVILTVRPVPVASVTIATPASIVIGTTSQLAVTLADTGGNILADRAVTYSTSAPAVATVSSTGLVTGVAAGSATITATSEGVSAVAVATVLATAVPLPTVTSVSPATLVAGVTATIAGSAFSGVPAENVVMIRGFSATVTAASPTQLTVHVPCMQRGPAAVQVTSQSVVGPTFASTISITSRTIALGQAIVFSDIDCNELSTVADARYLISVFTTAGSENTLTDFAVVGNPGLVTPTHASVIVPAALRTRLAAPPTVDAARDRAHFQMLERNRAILAEGRRLSAARPRLTTSADPAPPAAVGDVRDFFYTYPGGCQDTTQRMHTKAIYVGTKSVIWEDTLNTLQSTAYSPLAGYYRRLGQLFDREQFDVIKSDFGDPLLLDAYLAKEGKVNMVFSEKLNNSGAAAYVTGCDLYSPAVFNGSNFGLIFYGTVPTVAEDDPYSYSVDGAGGWFSFMNRTVVHEVKHIASLSAHLLNGSNWEESWLEEGLARHAEELWVRAYVDWTPWKSNAGWGSFSSNGIICDFRADARDCLNDDPIHRPSYGMRRHFNEILPHMQQPWNWSFYGDATGQSGSVFYQTAWSLVRFGVDRYAVTEASFFRAMTNSTNTGLSNLATVLGTTPDNLVGLWSLALYADDYPGLTGASSDIQMRTWNFRNIYAALNADYVWGSRFPTVYPVTPVLLPSGSFTAPWEGLRGGANMYFELAGTAIPQVLSIRGRTGGPASPSLRVAIARLK